MFLDFDKETQKKTNRARFFNFQLAYQTSFFEPFLSFTDAKYNVKAVVYRPLIDLLLMTSAALKAILNTSLGLVNLTLGIVTGDFKDIKKGAKNLKSGFELIISASFYALSIVTDCLDAILRLATHSLATMGSWVYCASQCVGRGFASTDAVDVGPLVNPPHAKM